MSSWLQPVEDALASAPAPIPVFFRDDDAGWGHRRLVELLDLFEDLPIDLAVIPVELDAGLAAELRARQVGLHQHGLAHVNHEREGRKHEFGPARDAEAQRRDIVAGRERLANLLGDRVDPIFTPPWNRCTPATGRVLSELGFAVLSREAKAEPLGVPGLAELPVTVDWVAARPDLGGRIAASIRSGAPVGLMFHHAVMDPRSMARMRELMRLLSGHERVRPARMMELAGSVVV